MLKFVVILLAAAALTPSSAAPASPIIGQRAAGQRRSGATPILRRFSFGPFFGDGSVLGIVDHQVGPAPGPVNFTGISNNDTQSVTTAALPSGNATVNDAVDSAVGLPQAVDASNDNSQDAGTDTQTSDQAVGATVGLPPQDAEVPDQTAQTDETPNQAVDSAIGLPQGVDATQSATAQSTETPNQEVDSAVGLPQGIQATDEDAPANQAVSAALGLRSLLHKLQHASLPIAAEDIRRGFA
ncbi:hypothetical protein FA95DRAFT_1129837 [Auriscalpium vulgare]|uniref:Uncharacterized protein n=1 Tax=Auriscalpium vulgare TaxID=40419 RepID=A0ACB8RVE3_9AGAM|nr:hypothetical protein FA95DRAFT_1129837 [Auriscalpium vulgare]